MFLTFFVFLGPDSTWWVVGVNTANAVVQFSMAARVDCKKYNCFKGVKWRELGTAHLKNKAKEAPCVLEVEKLEWKSCGAA